MQSIAEEIDKLTNSIENAVSGERFDTDILIVNTREIKKSDWLFDWKKEINDKMSILKEPYNADLVVDGRNLKPEDLIQIDEAIVRYKSLKAKKSIKPKNTGRKISQK